MKLPQLTLRDLFWLVLVCAMAVGWWIDHRRSDEKVSAAKLWEGRARKLKDHVEQFGGQIQFQEGTDTIGVNFPTIPLDHP